MKNERELKPTTAYRDDRKPNAAFLVERRANTFRLMFDLLKHLTTLNSGSILVVLALVEKFVKSPEESRHMFQAVVAFGISIALALGAMSVLAILGGGRRATEGEANSFAIAAAASGGTFIWGMLTLCISIWRVLG